MSKKSLENIANTLGISRRKRTTFEIEKSSDNEMKMSVKGKVDFNAPWFGLNCDQPAVMVPAPLFEAIIDNLTRIQRENFELKLEKSIWQHIPVDFGDVWSVAIDELRHSNFKKEPNLDQFIAKIKKKHPNLFVDMGQIFNQ